MKIQERLAEYVKERGIKQTAIAEAAGMTDQAMSNTLRGERELKAEEYGAICDFLGVSMDMFRNDRP